MMSRVLLVEDEKLFAKSVFRRLEKAGYSCELATDLRAADLLIQQQDYDAIMLDVRLPDGNGLDLLKKLRQQNASGQALPVVVMTAYGELEDAVAAMKMGASDYLKKPVDMEELLLVLQKIQKTQQISQQIDYAHIRDREALEKLHLIGNSPALTKIREQLAHLAGRMTSQLEDYPVLLLTGETGTGKAVAARYFHHCGSWSEAPFVHIDCSTLNADTFEAELFGKDAQPGLIEAAEHGTIFFDEVAELPLNIQSKLLNVLDCRMIRRVGSTQERKIAGHFVAATNRNLSDLVAGDRFRQDLYYRLQSLALIMPPLRQRQQDIAELAQFYIDKFSRKYDLPRPRLDYEAMREMQQYTWPGNIRELQQILERAVMLSESGIIHLSDLPLKPFPLPALDAQLQNMTLEQVEKYLLQRALAETGGNVSKAARQLGLTRMAMRYRMEKHKL